MVVVVDGDVLLLLVFFHHHLLLGVHVLGENLLLLLVLGKNVDELISLQVGTEQADGDLILLKLSSKICSL